MPVNRIARHLDPPTPAPTIPPKDDYKGRYEFVSDAVLRAVAAVTRLLNSDDPAVVMKAAKMILDLEKTRMRHGKEVHGVPRPESVERAALLPPLPDFATPQAMAHEDEDLTRPALLSGEKAKHPLCGKEREPADEISPADPDDDEPALTGEEEYRRWVTGYYYRDRSHDARPANIGPPPSAIPGNDG